jgi:thymidylate synthase
MYKHFKHPINGDVYEILHEALDSSDLSEVVVYKSLNTGKVWTRPKSEFFSEVEPGKPRFMLIKVNNNFDYQYIKAINHILLNGKDKSDRTGVGTRSVTSYTFDIDISTTFPLLTVKKTFSKSIFAELVWFLKGSTNSKNLDANIWDANSTVQFLRHRRLKYDEGYIGPSYGYQWRGTSHIPGELQWCEDTQSYLPDAIPGVDQIQYVINEINNNPDSRRILISNWDKNNIHNMALPPCHILFQIIVRDDYLDGIMYQRSADVFLGVPFNVASYSALIYILAKVTNHKPGRLVVHFGDMHIYSTHIEKSKQLTLLPVYDSPTLELNMTDIDHISVDDFKVINYKSGPYIKAEMAV